MENKQSNGHTPAPQKKVYAKPVLTKVRLAAEEAVLGNCKNNTGIGNKSDCWPGDLTCNSTPRS